MKIKYFALLFIGFTFSCAPEKQGAFKILPQPQQWEISGNSQLKTADLKYHFNADGISLPPGSDFLSEAKATDDRNQAQLVYAIDTELDLKAEGYLMDIGTDQIQITAKDQAGLIYGLATLEQLMEDAAEQNVYLPKCQIKDFPLLSCHSLGHQTPS
ncbi:MAG: hypothetical protein O2878_01435 [Bacteroidetes bacterium]|nr:hypothetical protein [Bacteroidota bacterium]MDA0935766.1 hypothetical protein [Bacteroidota bacterium]